MTHLRRTLVVPFVHAPGTPDPSIESITEREQVRPAIAGTPIPVGAP